MVWNQVCLGLKSMPEFAYVCYRKYEREVKSELGQLGKRRYSKTSEKTNRLAELHLLIRYELRIVSCNFRVEVEVGLMFMSISPYFSYSSADLNLI
jgi:hypothetical protein